MRGATLLLASLAVAAVTALEGESAGRKKRDDIEISAEGALGNAEPSPDMLEEALKRAAGMVDSAIAALDDPNAEVDVGAGKRAAQDAMTVEDTDAMEVEESEGPREKRRKRGWRVRIRVSYDKKNKKRANF